MAAAHSQVRGASPTQPNESVQLPGNLPWQADPRDSERPPKNSHEPSSITSALFSIAQVRLCQTSPIPHATVESEAPPPDIEKEHPS
jgi:hypothetical protein